MMLLGSSFPIEVLATALGKDALKVCLHRSSFLRDPASAGNTASPQQRCSLSPLSLNKSHLKIGPFLTPFIEWLSRLCSPWLLSVTSPSFSSICWCFPWLFGKKAFADLPVLVVVREWTIEIWMHVQNAWIGWSELYPQHRANSVGLLYRAEQRGGAIVYCWTRRWVYHIRRQGWWYADGSRGHV